MKRLSEFIIDEETVAGDVPMHSGQLMGHPVMTVSHDTFFNSGLGKKTRKRWNNHLGKTDDALKIQQFAKIHKGKQFFLKSDRTGEMVMAHRQF